MIDNLYRSTAKLVELAWEEFAEHIREEVQRIGGLSDNYMVYGKGGSTLT